jgi:transcriptional regulator with XRE-family HTH domain
MALNKALIEAFGVELKIRRAQLKLSQEELAHLAGINRTYIAKLELAQNQPTLSVLLQLAIALKMELLHLLHVTMLRYRQNTTGLADSKLESENSVWLDFKSKTREILIAAAKSPRKMITYSELVSKLTSDSIEIKDHVILQLLNDISGEESAAGRGILSAVVVNKYGNQSPYFAFYKLAEKLGCDTSDQLKCWLDELNKVCEYWSTLPK